MQIRLICIKEQCDSPVNTSPEIPELLENVMALLVWVPELDTGIAEIDRQHRRIVDYINKLYELRTSPDREALGEVIGEMIDYTVSHFVFEESLIESAGYMFAGPHKKVHELFTRRVIEMQTRFDAGEDVAAELHGMLSRWLFNHIRNEDTGYVDSAKAYLRMARESSPAAEKERLKNEVLQELELQRKKKGWLARLLNR
jgi:hemerythrin